MQAAGYTQEGLTAALGRTSPRWVNQRLTGRVEVKVIDLYEWAKVCGQEPIVLFVPEERAAIGELLQRIAAASDKFDAADLRLLELLALRAEQA